MRIANEASTSAIHLTEDHSAHAGRRRDRLRSECAKEGIELTTHSGVTVVPPGELAPTSGDHYRVFTPYWRAWRALPLEMPVPAPRRIRVPSGLRAGRVPALGRLTTGRPASALPEPGEDAARRRLDGWVRGGLETYEERHDDLAGERTSRLSADLHFGSLSPRAVLSRVDGRPGGEAFARQLCWRDFHHQVLAARPDITSEDYRPRGDRWRRDDAVAEAWCQGRTGYPIVDAGMRQLAGEGFMHNRARMIVASFLTKTLYLDWRLGARHFDRLLVDADVANNYGNWQWVAGTGNDTRPNRVINPLRQARRFDPDGEYVRRWVPELEAIDGRAVHRPWLLEGVERRRRLGYPDPIVDLDEAAAELRSLRASRRG
jgi:deoxyribodipyrimidine photo-lyase